MTAVRLGALSLALLVLLTNRPMSAAPPSAACFLLHEIGVGEVRRDPSSSCGRRFTPASTFKIPHALAALDAGVIAGPDTTFRYDGRPTDVERWRRDHTLQTAMRFSVLWYFQALAEMRRAASSCGRETTS